MYINKFIDNYYYYKLTLNYIILYCSNLSENNNFLNFSISKIISKTNGKIIKYIKIFNYNNIENNNIYLYLVFTHNNTLIRGYLYYNNKTIAINTFYISSIIFQNINYNNVIFCKLCDFIKN
jgi:hypothetical protein